MLRLRAPDNTAGAACLQVRLSLTWVCKLKVSQHIALIMGGGGGLMYHVTTTYVGWLVKRRSGPKEDKVAGDMSREKMHKHTGG